MCTDLNKKVQLTAFLSIKLTVFEPKVTKLGNNDT